MAIQLSSVNVFQYLQSQGLQPEMKLSEDQIEIKDAKNFNLLLKFSDHNQWLVKQERFNRSGQVVGEFVTEWQIQAFVRTFPELEDLGVLLPDIIHFDPDNAILVSRYLTDYQDVMEFYGREKCFPVEIAAGIGQAIAQVHRRTWQNPNYQAFLSPASAGATLTDLEWALTLERIGPEIFGQVPADGIKFYSLYQRYDSLGQSITTLLQSIRPCCLTHNDLKLNNILLDFQGLRPEAGAFHQVPIRLIDWERNRWGDPAFDLGTVIASYLQIWLNSLVISPEMSFEQSLRMAMIPLDELQPSISAFVRAYYQEFSELWGWVPNVLERSVQFAGLVLIQQIQAMLQYQKSFGNGGICMLQVAKSLLCRPERSITTIFGLSAAELLEPLPHSANPTPLPSP